MLIPQEFYYSETQNTIAYTRTSTNALSINQLIAGLPYWISSAPQWVSKPKKLILADWTARTWPHRKISAVKNKLHALIEHGFSIYIWRHGRVMALDISELYMLDIRTIRAGMTPAFADEVFEIVMTNNNIPRSQLFILDDYWIDHLLTGEKKQNIRVLNMGNLIVLSPDGQRKVIKMSKKATPALELIIENIACKQAEHLRDLLGIEFASTKIERQAAVHLNAMYHEKKCNEQNIDVWDSLVASPTCVSYDGIDVALLRSMKLGNTLMQSPKLKRVIFVGANNFAEMDFPIQFKALVEIDLSRSDVSLKNVIQFLTRSTLKQLILNECSNLAGELTFDPVDLIHLKSVSLSSLPANTLSPGNLQCLLNAPNIEMLTLSGCNDFNKVLAFSDRAFTQLKNINLSKSNISLVQLQLILERAMLRELYLADCPNLQGVLALDAERFSHLDSVDLSTKTLNTFSVDFLKQILNAPNLRVLNLSGCDYLEQDLKLATYQLLKLEDIDLSHSNISLTNLKRILAALNLIRLNLSHIDLDLDLIKNNLSKINEINLSHNHVSLALLTEIFRPTLRQLDLSFCKNIVNIPTLEINSLWALEALYLKGSPGVKGVPGLANMLVMAPNLSLYSQNMIHTLMAHISKDRAHDPHEMKNFIPNEPSFQFKHIKTKNQNMIRDRFSQYLTLEQKYLHIIPLIKDGMCAALSHYFLTKNDREWDVFINGALAWDGQRDSLGVDLINHFEALHSFIEQYQLKPFEKLRYLGDDLGAFLRIKKPRILHNAWHAIAIKPAPDRNWYVYDPNYSSGCKTVSSAHLLQTIHEAIGLLVMVDAKLGKNGVLISNPDQFIAHGGLFILCKSKNIKTMQAALPIGHVYSKEALDGLFLRSIDGYPAWVLGLDSEHTFIRTLTQSLKTQFETMHIDSHEQLVKSLDALTPAQRGELITCSVQENTPSPSEKQLIDVIRISANKPTYEAALETWNTTAEIASDSLLYSLRCLNALDNKRLIELESTQHVDGLRWLLQRQAEGLHRPVFYIDKPSDLSCAAPWIKNNPDNSGELHNGPGGPLFDFLQTNQDTHPLLLINYDQFNAADIVSFNGLLDELPHADGTPLPNNTQIIGLINRNKPGCYQGADFEFRFNRREKCPLSTSQLDALKSPNVVANAVASNSDYQIINLYHAADWEERLLGKWELEGNRLLFKEGELISAMEKGQIIEIQNGLWGESRFERFWQLLQSGGIRHAGRTIYIPEHIQLTRPEHDQYDWMNLSKQIDAMHSNLSFENHIYILNPNRLSEFLGGYVLEDNRLLKRPGLIEQQHNSQVGVNVTRTLGDDAWAMLLNECKQYNVRLVCYFTPNVMLPAGLNYTIMPVALPSNNNNDCVIFSSDIDTTVWMLIQNNVYDVIDVSECTDADLLMRWDGSLNEASLCFEFSQFNGALTTSLANQRNIILRGHFSSKLQDALAAVFLARASQSWANQLILVADNAGSDSDHPYVSNKSNHNVTPQEKRACLAFDNTILDQLGAAFETESLSQLNARCRVLQSGVSTTSDDAWLGMTRISVATPAFTQQIDPLTSFAEATMFMQARVEQVNRVLNHAPFVFLTGLTGVGKSTFVEKEYCSKNDRLYLTEARMELWAKDDSLLRKILFVDEANLSSRQWSEFEGLFNTPPSILIEGTLHRLTPLHKVIFAGNPVNYGDERRLAPFFQRHGNAVLFTPLSPAVIYEKILKPVFAGMEIENDAICAPILAVYRFICECSTTTILISPRELQMMALLTCTRAMRYPEQNIDDIGRHFSYELAKNLVPKSSQALFDERFKPVVSSLAMELTTGPFLVTPSRYALTQQLNDLLVLRHWRLSISDRLNDAQKKGGLGGILIEGEPGIGKSELVIAALRSHGYQQIKNHDRCETVGNLFYHMPVSMPLSEKEVLLKKAFNHGVVVVIDEMNSSPMMERLLNDLLMGKNPHNSPHTHVIPGFMVIGTQNPVMMEGRRLASTALLRRVITVTLPGYTLDEMKHILVSKRIDEHEADAMLDAYQTQRDYAKKHRLSPAPDFRSLIDLAKQYLRINISSQSKPMSVEPVEKNNSKKRTLDQRQATPSRQGLFKYALTEKDSSHSASRDPTVKRVRPTSSSPL